MYSVWVLWCFAQPLPTRKAIFFCGGWVASSGTPLDFLAFWWSSTTYAHTRARIGVLH